MVVSGGVWLDLDGGESEGMVDMDGGGKGGRRGGNEDMVDKRMKVDAGAMVVWEGKGCKSRFGRTWHLRTALVWGEGGGLGGGKEKIK